MKKPSLKRLKRRFLNFETLNGFVMAVCWFAFLGCWGVAMLKAYNRQRLELPVISELAQKFA